MGAGWWQPPGPPSLGDLHSICSGCWLAACRLHEQCFWMLRSSVVIKFFCEDTTTKLKACCGHWGYPFWGLLLWRVWLQHAWLAPGFPEYGKSLNKTFPSFGGQNSELLLLPAAALWDVCLSHSSCIPHASNKDQPLIVQVLQRRRFQVKQSFQEAVSR